MMPASAAGPCGKMGWLLSFLFDYRELGSIVTPGQGPPLSSCSPPSLCPSAWFKCAQNLHSNTVNADLTTVEVTIMGLCWKSVCGAGGGC